MDLAAVACGALTTTITTTTTTPPPRPHLGLLATQPLAVELENRLDGLKSPLPLGPQTFAFLLVPPHHLEELHTSIALRELNVSPGDGAMMVQDVGDGGLVLLPYQSRGKNTSFL